MAGKAGISQIQILKDIAKITKIAVMVINDDSNWNSKIHKMRAENCKGTRNTICC